MLVYFAKNATMKIMTNDLARFREQQWMTTDRRVIKVKDLTNHHLANILHHMLTVKPEVYSKQVKDMWISGFHDEAEWRGLTLEFLENAPYEFSDCSKEEKNNGNF